MKAVVVYESLWGNTAKVAHAIAAGLGPEVRALPTDEATGDAIAGADLIVAGGPVFAFHLSSERTRESIRRNPGTTRAPDLSHQSLRSWMEALPAGQGRCAGFDTEVRGPFGKGAPTIVDALEAKGYARLAEPLGFIVTDKEGPLKEGELERARAWGAELLRLMG
ncbi:MAG TPA: hypothetical protein PKN27_01875 [Propionibacteriaceae bacterium]|nr:hypothetical protein [Propionibacteriaceae bacterium]